MGVDASTCRQDEASAESCRKTEAEMQIGNIGLMQTNQKCIENAYIAKAIEKY